MRGALFLGLLLLFDLGEEPRRAERVQVLAEINGINVVTIGNSVINISDIQDGGNSLSKVGKG